MLPTLDKRGPLPLYHQLKAFIEERIGSGLWKPGDQLPSERQLCEQFQVSRITVRQAVTDLVSAGSLVRDQGRGTFVAPARVEQRLNQLTSFTQDIQARGKRPGAQVLQFETIPAPAPVARLLRLRAEEPVILLKRLRLTDGEPMAVETTHLPLALCPDLVHETLANASLYELLSRKFHVIPFRAEQQMSAAGCPPAEARLLRVPKGSPVLHIYRTTFTEAGVPFEQVESYYRGDKYVFNAELYAKASGRRIGAEGSSRS